jgi:23S rRNA (cytidine1920-2'-O)/16S rRNA (cytidine1409-2'-O)-methyltransferase
LSSRKNQFVALAERLRREHPEIHDPFASITAGHVSVDGVVLTNPRGLVRRHGVIAVAKNRPLRGALKLRAALTGFALSADGRIAVDLGASTGGFTTALLEAGARRVYAIDAGYGQLLGSLRQDERVVNLERTNLGTLTSTRVPEVVDLVTIDLSYLTLADAVPQLEVMSFAPQAELIGLVKPMYELRLPRPPTDAAVLGEALRHAVSGIESAPWRVRGHMPSPVKGGRGAIEFILHARRR